MRSRAHLVIRPLRSASPRLYSPSSARPILSTVSSAPRVATIATTSWKKQDNTKSAPIKPGRIGKTTSSRIATSGLHPENKRPPVEYASVDPQVAAVPASSVEDVDPALTGSMPNNNGNGNGLFAAQIAANGASLGSEVGIDWSSSFHGLSATPFSKETTELLMAPLKEDDIEIKPDGIIYLPEIKYRRILNQAFGPGGWGLAPRGELVVGEKVVTREYALIVNGRFIAQARGECQYFSEESIPTAGEGCKSNALMRCCKDLGIASELWDPRFIRQFKKEQCQEIWVEHVVNKKKRQIWTLKGVAPGYPYSQVRKFATATK